MVAEAQLLARPRETTLLCVDLPAPVLTALRAYGYRLTVGSISRLPGPTRAELEHADVVLLDVTVGGQDKMEVARRIRSAICMSGSTCPILCFSSTHRNPCFVLELTNCGARYVRIGDSAMLIETVELLVAEATQLERTSPCFCIRHRFSRGSCAPGEEIAAIELLLNGEYFQLPLALSGRFVFNCLAENRSIAIDAFQIASGLNGWFYREHGLNSGLRHTTKIRVATIKVLVQRIRQAMASVFARAGLARDPFDVLRSFPAEGSKRALYKLRADIRWEHREQ